MERTHKLRADFDWAPSHVRRTKSLIRGSTWAALTAGIVGTAVVMPGAAVLWKFYALGAAGAIAASERAAHSAMRKQLAKMTRGELALRELDASEEDTLVVVRGTIEAEDTLHGLLINTDGVYRRMIFKARGTWVHEAAVDFTLVDEKGDRIRVQAGGARWMTPRRELVTYPGARFSAQQVSAKVQQLAANKDTVDAIERVLPVGTQVQVVGYKTTTPDAGGVIRDYRSPPERATLRSGPDLPLVISRVDEAM
jgi:hypothetical protein